jgi:hypothetical protein
MVIAVFWPTFLVLWSENDKPVFGSDTDFMEKYLSRRKLSFLALNVSLISLVLPWWFQSLQQFIPLPHAPGLVLLHANFSEIWGFFETSQPWGKRYFLISVAVYSLGVSLGAWQAYR